jgi:exopolyphosphatase / guanosine-5'-triphosphate,3'-diphosphate pyrophosphatase
MAQISPEAAQENGELASRRRSNRPAQAAPELFAALDLGTNSCRMLIADARRRAVPCSRCLREVRPPRHRGWSEADISRAARSADPVGARDLCGEAHAPRGPEHAAGRDRGLPARAQRQPLSFGGRARDRAAARGDPAGRGGAARGDLLRAAGRAQRRAGAGLRHRWRLDRTGLDRPVGGGARAARTGDRQPAHARATTPARRGIVDFISVPLGVATLHERFADVPTTVRASR